MRSSPLYPVAEFRAVARRHVRWVLLTVLGAVITVLAFGVTAANLLDPWGVADPTYRLLFLWLTLAAASFTLAAEVGSHRSRHPYTRCPHCRRRLSDFIPLAVASGCCPYCGARVLAPTAEEPPPDALIPRAEFLAADTGYQNRGVPILIGGLFATYLGCGGAVVSLEHFHLPFPLNWVLFLALTLIAPVSLISLMHFLAAGGKRNPALACPTCGKLLAGARMLVAATGHCAECGGRAIVPRTRPLAPPHLAPLWTVAGISEREKQRRRRYGPIYSGLAFLTLLIFTLVGLTFVLDEWLQPSNWFAWWMRQRLEGVVRVLIVLGGVVVGWVLAGWAVRRVHRRHPLRCPRCGEEFFATFARATKCCNRCGWRIVAPL